MLGTTVPPESTVWNQLSSANSRLSVLSPVVMTQSKARPVNGPAAIALIRSTSETAPCVVSVSCGRKAGAWNGWTNSNRAGLCASTMCMSVSCTKEASGARTASRVPPAVASSCRTYRGQPAPSTSGR